MDFDALLGQVREFLQRQGRVSYRALKLRFNLDDEALAALKDELIYAQHVAQDEDDRVLVWTGEAGTTPEPVRQPSVSVPLVTVRAEPHPPEAERRQLTVLFCDLADSTRLSHQLDPEDLREVVLAYQATCVEALQRLDGYVAQYLGDGLLVYFGYPQAHEDDAQRAVRAGLGILDAMETLNTRLEQHQGLQLAIRIGIHTGPVVVGTMGSGGRHEQLALGETPNIAARLQSLAAPQTVAISDTTYRLVQGYFRCDDLGLHNLKGVETPLQVYRVLGASAAQSRLDVAGATGLTPLVGREPEVNLLQERWAQSTNGLGQVVLVSGEAGIGKSRLVHVLTERVGDDGAPRLTLRCSPYHANSAFYPVIEHLQRLLQWHRDETPTARLAALEQALQTANLPLVEVVPLLAALLAVPVPERYPPLTPSPQRQKQKTQEALVAWWLADAAQQPVLAVWEDLHWADPSTLELLALLLDQVPTAHLLLVLTARPEFGPPWAPRSHLTYLTLNRFTHEQTELMVARVAGGKALPAEVLRQVVTNTDGVPLFVEELTKTVLESGWLRAREDRYELSGPLPQLAIPDTLQDSLMARLDRLAAVKAVAQLGATLGRTFPYALLRTVAPWDEGTLQHALGQLIDAELLYQHGMLPQATYLFKHALIQEAAYQSLLRNTRRQYHQRIAQVLAEQFPETAETQPEVLAHHYTEAGLHEQAVHYWQAAGQRALQRSAYVEAMSHITKGLEELASLPETPARLERELTLYTALGTPLIVTKGYAAPEVEQAFTRARELCQRVGETSQLLEVLVGLRVFYQVRGNPQTARELGEQAVTLAERIQDPVLVARAHFGLGHTLFCLGAFGQAQEQLEQGIARAILGRDVPPRERSPAWQDPGVFCMVTLAWVLWYLGYPDQALARSREGLGLAQQLSNRPTQEMALSSAAILHQLRREVSVARDLAEAALSISHEEGFTFREALGTILLGWTSAMQGKENEGITEVRQGLAAYHTTGAAAWRHYWLALLAEAYGHGGQTAEGLTALTEALAAVRTIGDYFYEAEVHRLRGELLLAQEAGHQQWKDAEACFHQALVIARRQEAKSLELRAAMSLSRLWSQQGKRADAHELLAPIYGWFTEGFDSADLREAKALLDEWS